jgi:tetratricopeptide (TPR) repeat protein/TolB-like protein
VVPEFGVVPTIATVIRHLVLIATIVATPAASQARPAAPSSPQQTEIVRTPNRRALRLGILNFANVGQDSSLSSLARALPVLIAAGLLRNPDVTVQSQEELGWTGTATQLSDSFFNQTGVDFVLVGSFLEQLQKLRIAGELRDRRTNTTTEISPVVVELGDVYTGVAAFVRELKAVIKGMGDAGRANRVATLCFTNASPTARRAQVDLGSELGLSFTLLVRPQKVVIVPWLTSKPYCSRATNRATAALDSLRVDGVVTGTFRVSGNVIRVLPTLVLARGVVAPLPEIRGTVTDLLGLEMQLADQVGRLIDATAKGAGQWDVDALRNSRLTASELIVEAQRILATGQDTALATVLLNRAVAATPRNADARLLLGTVLAGQGRNDEAVKEIQRALDLGGPTVAGYTALGDLYVRQGVFDRALTTFATALRLDRSHGGTSAEILRKLGDVHLLSGRPDSAAVYYQRAQQLNPRDTISLNGLGQVYRLQGEFEKAVDAFERTLAIDSTNGVARSTLADLYQELGGERQTARRFEDARLAYARAIKYGGGASAFIGKAKALRSLASAAKADSVRERYYSAALEATKEALRRDSTYARAYVYQGAILLLGHPSRPQDALEAYDKAIALGVTYVDRDRAIALSALGRNDDALASLDRAVKSDTTDDFAWRLRARTLSRLERYNEALASAEQAVRLDPTDADNLLEKAKALRKVGRREEAFSTVQQVIKMDTLSRDAYALQGFLLVLSGRSAEGLDSYDRAVQLGAEDSHEMRGLAFIELGRFDDALKQFDDALRADPRSIVAVLGRARLLQTMRRYDEALRAYATAESLSPGDANALEGKAHVLVLLGRADEAIPLLEEAVRRDSADAQAHKTLAMALFDLGRYQEASSAFRSAAALDSNALDVYGISDLFVEMEMYAQARAFFDIARQSDSGNARAVGGEGYLLYRTGRREEGLQLMQRAARLDSHYGGALFNLARVAALERRTNDALKFLTDAIEREPRYKTRARTTKEFDALRATARFRKLVAT